MTRKCYSAFAGMHQQFMRDAAAIIGHGRISLEAMHIDMEDRSIIDRSTANYCLADLYPAHPWVNLKVLIKQCGLHILRHDRKVIAISPDIADASTLNKLQALAGRKGL